MKTQEKLAFILSSLLLYTMLFKGVNDPIFGIIHQYKWFLLVMTCLLIIDGLVRPSRRKFRPYPRGTFKAYPRTASRLLPEQKCSYCGLDEKQLRAFGYLKGALDYYPHETNECSFCGGKS